MMKSKFNKKLWGSRFKKPTDKLVEEYTESISNDFKLYKQDIRGSIAHVSMLANAGLVSKQEKEKIVRALRKIEKEITKSIQSEKPKFAPEYEDIHTYIEKKLTEKISPDIAGKIHTARSRNDQVAVDLRLFIRDDIRQLLNVLGEMCKSLLDIAKKYKDTIMPAYTHLQIAKPIYFSEYIMSFFEMFMRDISRIVDCFKRLNYSPLGAGAVGGTYYKKICREYIAKQLDFSGIVENAVDAVSDRDFVIEYIFTLSMIMMHISRLSEDFVIWFSPQFKFIDIDESYLTGSSILPQKKNPDVCELARARTGRLYGNLINLLTVMKALPSSYNRDLQEDKNILFNSSDTVKETLKVYTKMLKTVTVNKDRMFQALKVKGTYSTAEHIVDYLTEQGIPLRKSHEIVGKLIRYCEDSNIDFFSLTGETLSEFFENQNIDKKFVSDELLKVITEITCSSDKINIENQLKTALHRLKNLLSKIDNVVT
ncbi:MAG: argininosuccinate lyase [Elusimicrobiota bacterium]|nr:argininosuccinate lyase [Elusimicrobiota bacterium]